MRTKVLQCILFSGIEEIDTDMPTLEGEGDDEDKQRMEEVD